MIELEAHPQQLEADATEVSLMCRVRLDDSLIAVKSGTPLTPTVGGWTVACEEDPIELFASSGARGGEMVTAARGMVLETHRKQFSGWTRVRIADVDDYGRVRFEQDDEGPYLVLTPSKVLLVCR